ncbi:MAG: gamma-glutamylcyclotransferase [Stappiaceae bacterium]
MTSIPAAQSDPFTHHPELRDKIIDPEKSFFRTFNPADIDDEIRARGAPANWRKSDLEIEQSRHQFLEEYQSEDLWVFGYGSLMWDPGFKFTDVRHAHTADYRRRFCLLDMLGGRGSRDAPGLMAALDDGSGCDGLVFRISKEDIVKETRIIWNREMIISSYEPRFIPVTTAIGEVSTLAFIANHNSERICVDLDRDQQVRYIATGAGILGTSLEYIETLVRNLAALGIEDPDISSLLRDAQGYLPEA